MNTPFPCYKCCHLYVDCMQEDNPSYMAECKLGLQMGDSKCDYFSRWEEKEEITHDQ